SSATRCRRASNRCGAIAFSRTTKPTSSSRHWRLADMIGSSARGMLWYHRGVIPGYTTTRQVSPGQIFWSVIIVFLIYMVIFMKLLRVATESWPGRAHLCALVALLGCGTVSLGSEPESQAYETQIRPFFGRYCLECHGTEKPKGKLRLDHLAP